MWKDIPSLEGSYQASEEGCIRSIDRVITDSRGFKFRHKGVNLSPYVHKSGHLYVNIRHPSVKSTQQVHRLVMLTFKGDCPFGMEVRHIDGNPANNTLENLCYSTRLENIADTLVHGTRSRGEIHGMSKLKESDIIKMFSMRKDGIKNIAIAAHFGVTRSLVSNVFAGRAWAWLTQRENLI